MPLVGGPGLFGLRVNDDAPAAVARDLDFDSVAREYVDFTAEWSKALDADGSVKAGVVWSTASKPDGTED